MSDYVVGFCFDSKKEKVILIHKKRPDWQKNKFNGVGGKIEFGENEIECMIREFKEETGVETKEKDWKQFVELSGDYFSLHCFMCINDDYFENATTTTDEEIEKFNVVDIYHLNRDYLISNVPWMIQLCMDEDLGRMEVGVRYLNEIDE